MRILVIGCGSIGERHIKNLLSLGIKVLACDIDKNRLEEIKNKYKIEGFTNIADALKNKIDAAFICTPTNLHVRYGRLCAGNSIHLFIEKPISNSLEGVDDLIKIVKENDLVLLVGCNTRFLPSFKKFKELLDGGKIGKPLSVRAQVGYYLPYWRPGRDYTTIYSSRREMGGGVILDDIHEIDYLRYLLGEVEEVFCYCNKISDLETNAEDVADILLKFKGGIVAGLHLDALQPVYRRSCEIIGSTGILIWDYIEQTVKSYSDETKKWTIHYDTTDKNVMYIDEIKHFLNCIKGIETPMLDGIEAKRDLEIALGAKESSLKKRAVKV